MELDFAFFRRLNIVKIGSPPITGKVKGGPKKVAGASKAHNYVKPHLSTKKAEPDDIAKAYSFNLKDPPASLAVR